MISILSWYMARYPNIHWISQFYPSFISYHTVNISSNYTSNEFPIFIPGQPNLHWIGLKKLTWIFMKSTGFIDIHGWYWAILVHIHWLTPLTTIKKSGNKSLDIHDKKTGFIDIHGLYGGFLKWGYPKLAGWWWKNPIVRNGWWRGVPGVSLF